MKEFTSEEIKNRLSNIGAAIGNIALEYISELEKQVSYLEDNLRVARKDREWLQDEQARGIRSFVKDYPATSLRFLANLEIKEENRKLKQQIKEMTNCLNCEYYELRDNDICRLPLPFEEMIANYDFYCSKWKMKK